MLFQYWEVLYVQVGLAALAEHAWKYPSNLLDPCFLLEELIWWNLIFFMADIDECKEKSVCGTVARCENMLGMFDCTCPQGYRYVEETKRCLG